MKLSIQLEKLSCNYVLTVDPAWVGRGMNLTIIWFAVLHIKLKLSTRTLHNETSNRQVPEYRQEGLVCVIYAAGTTT